MLSGSSRLSPAGVRRNLRGEAPTMNRLALLAAVLAAFLPAAAAAQQSGRARPALIVHIAVDQMRHDYLERFRPQFTGGLARLLEHGAVFTQAYQDHALTETAPGHATMLSGRYPYSTGIIRNSIGVGDTTAPLVDAAGPGASPRRFHGTALIDWMRARRSGTRMLSVSRKDRGAILPVGRSRRNVFVYWYGDNIFTTSTYYARRLPAWLRAFNMRAAAAYDHGLAWTLLRDSTAYPEPDSQPLENRGRLVTFPHYVQDLGLASMPWMDSLVLALALDGIRELRLGRSLTPEVVSVSLSTLDAVGHTYGPDSREVHDLVLRIDRYLGAFLDSLDRRYGPGRVLVSLTGDHGVTPSPDDWSGTGQTGPGVLIDSTIREALGPVVQRMAGTAWRPSRSGSLVMLDRPALEAAGVNADSVATELARHLARLPGVAQADTRASLAVADTVTNTPARRWRRMLFPGAPGDVFITLAPLHYYGRPAGWNHGQPSDHDAHVPFMLMGPGVRPGWYTARVAVVDLAPTLAELVGARPTEPVDGRVLREALQ